MSGGEIILIEFAVLRQQLRRREVAQQIDVSGADPLVEFEPRDWEDPPPFRAEHGRLYLADALFPYLSSIDIGNPIWRSYGLQLGHAVDFFVWLHGSGLFQCTQAESDFFTRWRWREPLKHAFVEHWLRARLAQEKRHA